MSITVLCPSRGRPDKAAEAFASFTSTKTEPITTMIFVVDADDPTIEEYRALDLPVQSYAHSGGMGAALNAAAEAWWGDCSVLGFVGDDHRFRTPGWDQKFEELFTEKIGFAYGNDLARNDIPTQVFISSSIVGALGWMALPGAIHLYLDNAWQLLGSEANCLYYAKDIVIEHAHAFYGKAAMDEGYERVNAPAMYQHDADVYAAWISSGQAEKDVALVKAIVA